MSDDVLRDALAAGLATLSRVVAVPVAPLGYGRDLSCASDITATLEEVDPNSPIGIGQAVFRRWDCPRGALPPDAGKDSKDYGRDLRGALNRGTTDADLNSLGASLRSEATKDDRIAAIPRIRFVPTKTSNPANVSIEVAATITPADPSLGSFDLILAVEDETTVLVAIGNAS